MNNQPIDHLIKSILSGVSTEQLEIECKQLNLNETNEHGRTPLMVAACAGLLPVVKMLVKNGASVHTTGNYFYQMTALHEAVANGNIEIAKYLLSMGAEVDAETLQKVTPLMCAAAFGYPEVVQLLLENGADPMKTDDRGATAEDSAREKGEDAAAEVIHTFLQINARAKPSTDSSKNK